MLRTIVWGLCLLGVFPAAHGADPPAKKENFHLFLLVGQSNMAGRGTVSEADRTPHPRVLMFNKNQKWVPAIDPLHFDKPGIVGTGLGKTFAMEVAEAYPDVTIGLIPCAVGGSPISSWEPGGYHEQTKSHPWDDCVKRAHAALPVGTLKGILWHQGESDAKPELAVQYGQKLEELITRFRHELESPNVPFLIGQMGKFEEVPWSEGKKSVDQAHQAVAKSDPLIEFISAEGLNHKGDKVHFDADSYREFGKRYANAYLELVRSRD
ncbi:MAG: sialate O-acetylesterase [Planctomycetaceae bacterium]|nr:sialate O-acetylesterase [Planctomycetaceae bacterium]